MKYDVEVRSDIVIPGHELQITSSRAGGPGGQHVNKTDSRITVRWNILTTEALNETQKSRVLAKLQSQLTSDGDFIVHSSEFRSQEQNRQAALVRLAEEIRQALYVPKKRIPTKVSRAAKQNRLDSKSHAGAIKKMRSKKNFDN
jgi:ribosome-associated protein